MYFFKIIRLMMLMSFFILPACDDLDPSGVDMRQAVVAGSDGVQVTQQAIDFVMPDTLGVDVTLSTEYPLANGVVLYFTMWCPVCDSHMSYLRNHIVPDYPNVTFLIVDYVTGSVEASRQAQLANGFSDFRVLVDADNWVQQTYNATMGTVIVIDSSGIIKMNEDLKDGVKLNQMLSLLP